MARQALSGASQPGDGTMSDEQGREDQDGKKQVSREERLEKIRRLIASRGEDAAKVLKTWLQQDFEQGSKRK